MSEVFQMGGDAAYVWPAYGITLALLLLNAWSARRKRIVALRQARDSPEREVPRKQPTVRQVQ